MLPRAAINVTPMMDVMLVVLVYFMVIMPTINAGVDLPAATHADPRRAEQDEIVLKIDRNGIYVLERPDVWGSTWGWDVAEVVTPDLLRLELGRLYGRRTKDRVLYLKADTNLPFGVVQRAIEIGRESGARVVAVVTERRPVEAAPFLRITSPPPSSSSPHTAETHPPTP